MAISLCSFVVTALAAAVIYYIFFKKGSKKEKHVSSLPKSMFFRNCAKPTTEPVQGKIKGEIPKWLEGTLTRNGTGIFKVGNYEYNHFFDGLAVLHRFHISNGKATYTSRALESDAYKRNMAAQRIVIGEFGTIAFPDPCLTIFQRFQTNFSNFLSGSDDNSTDNCCVNVAYYGDQLYAMTETNFVRRIDPANLKCIGGRTRINDYVAVNGATAHPHVLEDGSVINSGTAYRGKNGSHYCIIKVAPSFNSNETSFKNSKILAQIPFASKRFPCYSHSFGMTNNDIAIFIESPLRLDIFKAIARSFVSKSVTDCMTWDPSLKTKIHVVSLKDGKIHPVIYETDPLFTFHHINAYEEDGQLVVDIAAYPRGDLVLTWEVDNVGQQGINNDPIANRFVLPLNVPANSSPGKNLVTLKDTTSTAMVVHGNEDGKPRVHVTGQVLAKESFELPRINYKYNGQKYTYTYGVSSAKSVTSTEFDFDKIIKINVQTKEVKEWYENGKFVSEPIFVPNPEGKGEDDGVLLSSLLHKDKETAVTLLILDAKDLKEISRIEYEATGSVTSTFHGQWAQNGSKVHTY